jgi:hypothetical protein
MQTSGMILAGPATGQITGEITGPILGVTTGTTGIKRPRQINMLTSNLINVVVFHSFYN